MSTNDRNLESPQYAEKQHQTLDSSSQEHDAPAERRASIIGAKSPGVVRIEAISSQLTNTNRAFLFLGVFIISYAYSLDGATRYVYQGFATASYQQHSLLATIGVLRGVIAAVAQPTAAKIADVFGRLELVAVSVVFYILGTIVESVSNGVSSFSAGAVLYQIGYTCILCLVEVIIADTTSMKNRVFFSYIPALPFLINAWVSGNVTGSVLAVTTWRWGIGMWCIIYFACSLPLMGTLWWVGRRARRSGALENYTTPFQSLGPWKLVVELFWQLDVIGIILMIAVFALILTPLTLAGGVSSTWHRAHIIAPLVIGILCIPAFILWERKAKHALIPFHLLKNRGVWAALLIAANLNFAWYMQFDFLFAVLQVAFDFDVITATRITNIYSFVSVVIGVCVGLVITRVRRLKPFIIAGTCLFMVSFGLLIHFRGDVDSRSQSGVIGAQVLLGVAGGLFPYVTQASIQACTQHEHVAVVTGLYLASYSIGSALGACVSGALWTQTLFAELSKNLDPLGNATLATAFYQNPYGTFIEYPVGTPERTGMIVSYQYIQKLLCIVGISLCAPLILWSLLLRNPRLSDEQSQPEAEQGYEYK